LNVIRSALVSKNNIGKHLIFIVILLLAGVLCFVSGLLQPKELLSTICLLIVLWVLRNTLNQYKNLFTNILLSLFVVWVSASIIDLGYHLYQIYSPKPPGERLESDVETIFKYRPNQVIYDSARYGDLAEMGRLTEEYPQTRKIICQIDELGYRNPIGQKNKKNKVLLIGDSFGFGAVDDDSTIAGCLKNDYNIPTYNISIPGYGPWQEYYTLRQEIDKINKADTCTVVWLLFTGNDLAGRFDSVNVAGNRTNWRDDFYSFRKQSPMRKSFLEIANPKTLADKNVEQRVIYGDTILFYKKYLEQERLTEKQIKAHPNYSKFTRVIDDMKALCAAKKVGLITVIICAKERFIDKTINPAGLAYVWAKQLKNKGIAYISYPLQNPGENPLTSYFKTDTHLNDWGNFMVARSIAILLKPENFPPTESHMHISCGRGKL
jgi:hypothetical protein